jgi:hypothetical protein
MFTETDVQYIERHEAGHLVVIMEQTGRIQTQMDRNRRSQKQTFRMFTETDVHRNRHLGHLQKQSLTETDVYRNRRLGCLQKQTFTETDV